MFLDFYGLHEQPFGVTPDPRFLFLGESHREALASLFCGIEGDRGFMALIAQPGLGKTTLTFQLLEKLQPTARTAFMFQTQCNSRELFQYVLNDLEIDCSDMDNVSMHNKLNEVLYKEKLEGRRVVLAIDEAQNLTADALEAIRLLSNFETHNAKLIHILLIGQPQLAVKLTDPSLLQLEQRISMFVRLEPFGHEDTSKYVAHRLTVAGYTGDAIFTPAALQVIAERSQGNPRNINRLCFGALSLGCAMGQKRIDSNIIHEAAADLHLEPPRKSVEAAPAHQNVAYRKEARGPILSYQKLSSRRLTRSVLATAAIAVAIALGIAMTSSPLTRGWMSRLWPHKGSSSRNSASPTVTVAIGSVSAGSQAPLQTESASQLTSPAPSGDVHSHAIKVVVHRGDTLRQISLRTLSHYSSGLVAQIKSMNLAMRDPNHIEPNQEIWLPRALNSATIRSASAESDLSKKN